MSECRLDPSSESPGVEQRPLSLPNVYTVCTGHRCCRHRDWFTVPQSVTVVTSCRDVLLHTPAAAAHTQETRAGLQELEVARALTHPLAGVDFALNRPGSSLPLPPRAFTREPLSISDFQTAVERESIQFSSSASVFGLKGWMHLIMKDVGRQWKTMRKKNKKTRSK
ncbi:hypothetical protein E5288_WYG008826 [Bos mutus]|uniref:Uncharacterized protein n=1 Tax=Bos mutus TaxID=72004 RepID=A0A6B0RCJ5_9CETA|nr:hypothetical protein [Bos mutus]